MKYYSCKDPHIKVLVALKAITTGILPTSLTPRPVFLPPTPPLAMSLLLKPLPMRGQEPPAPPSAFVGPCSLDI